MAVQIQTATIKHQCVIHMILIQNPKHSTLPVSRMKIHSIPAETRIHTNSEYNTAHVFLRKFAYKHTKQTSKLLLLFS